MAKQVTVTAIVELTHEGQRRVPGECFECAPLDAVLLGQRHLVSLTRHPGATPEPPSPKRRRGVYQRRDMVARTA